ncbi:MAG: hypothetical protein N2Z62_08630 [Rhodobacteraceae bacterium]|nr:hypothetical protein [Paracoccaceae bacterium]
MAAWAEAHDGLGRAAAALAAPAAAPAAVRPAAGPPCALALGAEAGPGATVRLRLEAPCLAGQPATIRHGALAATYLVPASGIAEAVFPAFATDAAYTAELADGRTLLTRAAVPGAAGYEHVASMWSRGAGLSVHAFEFGAPPGSEGHVRAEAPRSPAASDGGLGGYLLALGTPGLAGGWRAEVYSFPAAAARRSGTVRIGFGLPAGGEACAAPVEAVTLQLGEGLPGAPVRVSLPAPGCGAAARPGGMLKNLARDLKIAGD